MVSMKLSCQICKKEMTGYSNKKTCGPTCKKKLLVINNKRKMNEEICSFIG